MVERRCQSGMPTCPADNEEDRDGQCFEFWYRVPDLLTVMVQRMSVAQNQRWDAEVDLPLRLRLREHLDAFDIVGTMQRFDESLLLAHDLVGLPI